MWIRTNASNMKNRILIEKWYYQMWNQWDETIFPKILDRQITFRGSLGQEKKGYDGLSEYINFIKTAFPDFHNEIEFIITEGDCSFAKLKYSGTHRGEVFGIAPTHRKIAYYGSAVFTFENEKIKDVWVLGDIYGLVNQLKYI